ncbi:MAG TPA: thiolase domain-containing protein [Anaerolineales bacterium]|nr:thiolase domain-containing protein [Anaerolineales bacterium]
MRDVYILGLGQTEVGEHWETSLRHLALVAVEAALKDSGVGARSSAPLYPDALFVGNMLAGQLSGQEHLGALIADFCRLRGIEAATVEAAGASGGLAFRQAYLAVASGLMDSALAVGVEKITDKVGSGVNAAAASAADGDWEAAQGITPTASAALLMRRYMHEHSVTVPHFAGFSINAHANAKSNPYAMYHNTITAEAFAKAPMVADPVNMFDTAPDADGAAAVLLIGADALAKLQTSNRWRELPTPNLVRVAGSAVATDALAIHDRPDPLSFRAASLSANKALAQAGINVDEVNVFELHDAFTILTALSLEAIGVAERGLGWKLAADGGINLKGRAPISTFGGLKARGNPGGATGLYQIVEVALQLRGQAGANQVPNAEWGLAQCLGSAGATAVTHVLQRA